MNRADFLGAPAKFNLSAACTFIAQAFPRGGVYLVGSSLERRDYRDVDVRVILDDAEFDRLFPTLRPIKDQAMDVVSVPTPQLDATWSLLCAAISGWLESRTGLPVDFQIQRQTQANAQYEGKRSALGMYYGPPEKAVEKCGDKMLGVPLHFCELPKGDHEVHQADGLCWKQTLVTVKPGERNPSLCRLQHHPERGCSEMPPGWHDCPKHFHLEPDGRCECGT